MSAALQLPIPRPATHRAPRLNTRLLSISAAVAASPIDASPVEAGPARAMPGQRKPVASITRQASIPELQSIALVNVLIHQSQLRAGLDTAPEETVPGPVPIPGKDAIVVWAFYRKHTENMLRRYLYASLQVGRSPSLLGESVGRGWVSSRRVRTFEDAVIFVLDIERCLEKLSRLEQQLISRIVLQEYTHSEAASFLGLCQRTVLARFPEALDHLTELLVEADLLAIPD
jgi:hypothetical protein